MKATKEFLHEDAFQVWQRGVSHANESRWYVAAALYEASSLLYSAAEDEALARSLADLAEAATLIFTTEQELRFAGSQPGLERGDH